jgi:acetyltransferase (GNAT) family protein
MNLTSSVKVTNSIKDGLAEIRIAGKTLYVPCAEICGRTVVVTGNLLLLASVRDENVVEGEIVDDPVAFLEAMKTSRLRADVLTFTQKLPETTPKYDYTFQWESCAVVPITCFSDWWERRLPQETRKNVRRAAKRGVTVKIAQFDDEFVKGIHGIYNESPVRQGRRFWHFGKDLDTVKWENATYLDRSDFVGAYFNEELIGFIKVIYVDRAAHLIQILAKNAHRDKRAINALLARTVELCENKGISYLIYGKYVYDRNEKSPFTEFKRRNGFEEVRYPRYYLPLSAKGMLAIKLGLHKGAKELIPLRVLNLLKSLRAQFYRSYYSLRKTSHNTVSPVR